MRILLYFFAVLILYGCNEIQLGDSFDKAKVWNKYHIEAGGHHSNAKLWSSANAVRFQADLSQALYETQGLGVDSLDWNKLYGISSHRVHKDSYRIGFRRSGNVWEFAAYYYVNGIRGHDLLGATDLYCVPEFVISLQEGMCYFEMVGQMPVRIKADKPNRLYRSFPHFGGNQKAPNAMDIWIKELQ